jgi:hypothetical protein
MGFKFSVIDFNFGVSGRMKELFTCYGYLKFAEFYRTFVLFWYTNNGWNFSNKSYGLDCLKYLTGDDKIDVLNHLPLKSYEFEDIWKEIIKSNKNIKA